MKHKEQRVLVLFDVQNLYYSAKHLYNTKVNFKEILNEAVSGRKLIRSIAYAIKTEIKEESNFHEALNNIGIEVKTKDLQVFHGGAKKGDWDIGIAMDAVRMVDKIDTLVLISGDGDFKELLEYMKAHGCRTEVIAIGRTSSKHLKESADMFTDIESNINKYLIGKVRTQQPKQQQQKKTTKKQYKKTSDKAVQKPAEKKEEITPKKQIDSLSESMKKNASRPFSPPQENSHKSIDEPDFDIYDDMDEVKKQDKKALTKKTEKTMPEDTAKKPEKEKKKAGIGDRLKKFINPE